MLARLLPAVVLAAAAAALAYRLRFLTAPGAAAAFVLGTLVVALGGWPWGVALAGTFLLTSLLARRQDRIEGNAPEAAEARRHFGQVVANGLVLAGLALLRLRFDATVLDAAFLGGVGAVTGDTWATSVGEPSRRWPRIITSGEKVRPGTPGAITITGLVLSAAAGLAAAALYLATVFFLPDSGPARPAPPTGLLLAGAVGALVGSMADSVLGATCQAIYRDGKGRLTDRPLDAQGTPNRKVRGLRWLDNNRVNFLGSAAGALAGASTWIALAALSATG